jgi:hypothetical protein
MNKIRENLSKLSGKQVKTRSINFVPIVGGIKMMWEIIQWKQFISGKRTTYIGHILASTWQLWSYAIGISQAYISYKQWVEIDLDFLIQILGSSSLIIVAKIGHGLGISKEVFDTLRKDNYYNIQEDQDAII